MGYTAEWGGHVVFNKAPSEEILSKIKYVFNDIYRSEEKIISVGGYDKYHEEDVYELLDGIAKDTESGEIEYSGEDNSYWRFIFKDGKWIEESGWIYYESELPKINTAQGDKEEFLGRIIDVMQDCLDEHKGETIEGETYDNIRNKLTAIMKAWCVFE